MGSQIPEKNENDIVNTKIKKMELELNNRNSEINKLESELKEKSSEIKRLEDELLKMGIIRVRKETYHHSNVAPGYRNPSISYEYGKPSDYTFNSEQGQGYTSWKYFQETSPDKNLDLSNYNQGEVERIVTEINKLKNEIVGIETDLKEKINTLGELNRDIALLKRIAEKSKEGKIELRKETYHHSNVAPGYRNPSISYEKISSMDAFQRIKSGEQGSGYTSWKYFIS